MAKLLLLGPAREAAQRKTDEFEELTVGAVLDAARQRYGPQFEAILDTSNIWLNGDEVSLSQGVGPDDEIAVLPPVSGG